MMEFFFLRLLCLLRRHFWSSSWRKNLAAWLCTHYVLDLDDLVLRQCQWSASSVRWNCLFARILKYIVGSEWTESCCWEHVSSLVSRAELLHPVLSTATLEVIRGFCDFYTIFHCIASLIGITTLVLQLAPLVTGDEEKAGIDLHFFLSCSVLLAFFCFRCSLPCCASFANLKLGP